jgi:hypothetical protein
MDIATIGLIWMLAGGASQPAPDLSWLAGYWLSCEGGREVSETWSDPRNGVMVGSSLTVAGAQTSWEQMRIESRDGVLHFVADPRGQAEADFLMVATSGQQVAFENLQHAFPQRIVYRREADGSLTSRIEGKVNGVVRFVEWKYVSKPLNTRCPGH